jgi:hypothetical protein
MTELTPPLPHFCRNNLKSKELPRKNPFRPTKTKHLQGTKRRKTAQIPRFCAENNRFPLPIERERMGIACLSLQAQPVASPAGTAKDSAA